jgi:transposase
VDVAVPTLWAGVDAGKLDHHCVAMDSTGQRVLSRRVRNDEGTLTDLIDDVIALAGGGPVQWAIDLNAGGAALLITLLLARDQDLLYIPGRTVHHASAAYRGDGKTDAKDAGIIADQARMRRDLIEFRHRDAITVDLRILCSRRTDVSADRGRAINRLRAQLLEYFPALERAFDYAHRKGALILLTGYQTPEALRRIGAARLETWLRARHVYNAAAIATGAIEAAHAQHTVVVGQRLAAAMVARIAQQILNIDTELAELDAMIEDRFHQHPRAPVIRSMPGFATLLGAELLAATNGDLGGFHNADRLAAVAGLAPVPRDSGRISGNLKRPRRYDRRLLRVFYLAAYNSLKTCAESRAYYDRKRAEGKLHHQAVLSLARRRVNVVWAMQRDNTAYQPAIRIVA